MKTILVIFVLALSLNAQTLATVNNQTIEKTLLIQEAQKENLDKTEEFKNTIEDFKNSLLVEFFMKNEFSKIEISKNEVENYYNSHLYEFQQDKKLKANNK